VNNSFMQDLRGRSERQVAFSSEAVGVHVSPFGVGARKRLVYLAPADLTRAQGWEREGYTEALRTPDSTLVFETPEHAAEIMADQIACMGCLSECRFSNWSQHGPEFSNGRKADPRSFCIQKTLQAISHAAPDDLDAAEHNLMFGGQNACRFASDPFYSNGFVPTVKQLFDRILTGR